MLQNPLDLLYPPPSNQNLHLIAISNLEDSSRNLVRFWCKKYKTPEKPLDKYTIEELLIEYLEDFYDTHPVEINKFLATVDAGEDDWDGTMPKEYEEQESIKKFIARNKVDITKYQSKKELSEKEEEDILNNLGKRLSGSKTVVTNSSNSNSDEFEEIFA